MKPFKGKWADHGRFDDQAERESRRNKRSRKPADDEDDFDPRFNHPADVDDLLSEVEEDDENN